MQAWQLSGGFCHLPVQYISRMGKKGSEHEETLLLDHLVSNPRCAVTQVISVALIRTHLILSNFFDNCCRSTTAAPKIFHLLRTSGCHSAPQELHIRFGSLALWNYQGRWFVSSLPVLCERVIGRRFLWDFCPYPDSWWDQSWSDCCSLTGRPLPRISVSFHCDFWQWWLPKMEFTLCSSELLQLLLNKNKFMATSEKFMFLIYLLHIL